MLGAEIICIVVRSAKDAANLQPHMQPNVFFAWPGLSLAGHRYAKIVNTLPHDLFDTPVMAEWFNSKMRTLLTPGGRIVSDPLGD